MPKKLNLVVISFFVAAKILCQERISTDRPDQTETADITPLHYFQSEFGVGVINHDEKDRNFLHPTVLLKYGLFKKLELRLEATVTTEYEKLTRKSKTTTGIEPVELGFKLNFFEQKNILPKTSLITHFAIPVLSSPAFKTDHAATKFILVMLNDITDKIGLGYNVGPEWDGFSSAPNWIYTVSIGFDLAKDWEAYVETFGSAHKNRHAENSVDGGIAFYISNNIKVDAYGGLGISKQADNSFFGAGISLRFK